MDYMSTDVGADSSSRFPFRAWTHTVIHRHKVADPCTQDTAGGE